MRNAITVLFFLLAVTCYAQLGFCPGSKGDPLFTENFGNGTTYGPALPTGTTTYPFIPGAPNDGFYTLFYHSNFFQPSWHYSLDHTPDATNGPNGKMLLMNANAVTSGDFYKKTVTGLCVNTTFEFSAWLLNVYNPTSNICVNQIPINVRFEIWNSTETILLGSGNTGNIFGTATPNWQQFALVFTTVSETSVVLKMKNNGVGGCGNDLAIDDISFSACGELTTVSSPGFPGTTFTTCNSPASIQLDAATSSATPYVYQWQSSPDGIAWTNVPGANSASYTPSVSSLTYFRVKAAQDLTNLNNPFCSTASNIFTINVSPGATPATNDGDKVICSDEPIPALSVTAPLGSSVNWYDAPASGTLLQANNPTYTPAAAGIYYAEAYNATTNCIATPRTPVALSIIPLPDATISGTTTICGGNTAVVSFSGTPNASLTYTVNNAPDQVIFLNASGVATLTTPVLTTTTIYTLTSVNAAALNTCSRVKNDVVTITVNNSATASFSSNSPVCQGTPATITFTGTPNATVSYSAGSTGQTVVLDASGNATVVIPSVTSSTVYTLTQVSVGGACTQPLSQSLTVTSIASPTASIAASPTAVCANQTSTITITGTPNAIVTYTVDSGANQTVTLNGSGSATITTPALTANTTYALVSAALPGSSPCTANISGSITIAVGSLATASISSNSPVCNGTSATVSFTGTPNATVSYSAGSANQTITLNASGNASVSIPNVTSATIYALTSVTAAGPNACTQPLSQSITVSASPSPTASITANPIAVCSNQSTSVQFNGTPNAIVTYTVNSGPNQTITLNGTGIAALTATLAVNTTYELIGIAVGGCSETLSDAVTVTINPTPTATYSGDLIYCEGEPIAIALSSNLAGTTFSWTAIENGTSGATSGNGNQIAQTLTLNNAAAGTVTYTVTPSINGCNGNPVTIVVNINPKPVPQITDGMICLTGPTSTNSYTLNTNLNPASHTFQWFFGANPIPGAFGSTYNATQIGTYSVIATNSAGCVSDLTSAVVGEMEQGESLVISQSTTFSDNPRVTVTVVGGDGPFFYQMDNGPFQTSNVFSPVSDGTHVINVIDAYCTNLTATVTIIDYPKYFTPNGDGINDTWNITAFDDATIFIFDRYGKLLKQISPVGFGWDGTYNGQVMPSSDYWFTIEYFENGNNNMFKAHFSLKR